MFCPSCGNLLQALEVTTNSGGKFAVDHCGHCGGTWFDPYEINRIPYHEVTRLAHLTVLPKKPAAQTAKPLCPHCHKVLSSFQCDIVPHGVRLLRCTSCHGIWAAQKVLEEFKKQQEKTVAEYKTSKVAFPSLSVVFIPALFIVLLFLSTFMTVTSLREAREGRIKAAELISQLQVTPISSTSVSLTFQTKLPVKSKIAFGPSTLEMTTRIISSQPTTDHRLLTTNLVPNTVYLYRITLEDENGRSFTTSIYSFAIDS